MKTDHFCARVFGEISAEIIGLKAGENLQEIRQHMTQSSTEMYSAKFPKIPKVT